jgi:glycosyltransferase involved in cell wall biosynthesis
VSDYVKSKLTAAGIDEDRISVVYDGVPIGPVSDPCPGGPVIAPATRDIQKGSELVKAAAAIAGVEVHFSTDLARDLRGAGAFVYITREEGLGSGALLAMSAGVPVIASRVGGLAEVVTHGETGLLVDNTPEAIAAAIGRVLRDSSMARALGAAGRLRAEERFSVERMVRETLAVYDRVLAC